MVLPLSVGALWFKNTPPPPQPVYDGLWQNETPADSEAIQWFVASLVPGLVLQVEDAPGRGRRGLLHWDEDELREAGKKTVFPKVD